MTKTPADTVLLAGFEPFGEFTVNPSQLVVEALDGQTVNGYRVKGIVLPVVFGVAGDRLTDAIAMTNPKAVICLGLAADRKAISLERLAVNLDDARMPDNAGNRPVDCAIVPDGPPACWSTLPVKAMAAALTNAGIPASLSMSAGTYVCNHVFYRLMRILAERPSTIGGFVHLPPLQQQAEGAGTTPATLLAAMTRIIETLPG